MGTRHEERLREGNRRLLGFYLDEVTVKDLEADGGVAIALELLESEVRRRAFHSSAASLGDGELRTLGGCLSEYANQHGIDGQLIWRATLAFANGGPDASHQWDLARVAINQLWAHLEEVQPQSETGKKRRWSIDQAKPEVQKCLGRGITGRNQICKETGIPAGTVSKALKSLGAMSKNVKPRQIKTRSLDNLANVELARLVMEQVEDNESSPLDPEGDSPKVDLYQD